MGDLFRAPPLNITLKHHDIIGRNMGLRDWFKSGSSSEKTQGDEAATVDEELLQAEAFAELQASKTDEALSLFSEKDVVPSEETLVAAPYDAGDASLEDLLTEEHESFTHADEVDVVDVASLDDPYLQASIEGDVPEAVVFDEDENAASV
tara:strand:+ start:190 stop:639 length:450 start_codon:yes stop_codon:yes gene_type:complete